MTEKTRLDQTLLASGFFESRARAQEAIRDGMVLVNGRLVTKASQVITISDKIIVDDSVHDYVSRGALKLAHGLDHYNIDPAKMTCLDLGASTGGFCDVLLRRNAEKIYAIDVGHKQLHPRIVEDPRVINLEKTHAKDVSIQLIPDTIDLLVCDVSFISLKKALPPALYLLGPGGFAIVLIKPQFEMGRDFIGRGGLVMASEGDYTILTDDIIDWFEKSGFVNFGVVDSPIKGGDGNREFLIGARKK